MVIQIAIASGTSEKEGIDTGQEGSEPCVGEGLSSSLLFRLEFGIDIFGREGEGVGHRAGTGEVLELFKGNLGKEDFALFGVPYLREDDADVEVDSEGTDPGGALW